jgi:putative peptide zinc metalloprotease protein
VTSGRPSLATPTAGRDPVLTQDSRLTLRQLTVVGEHDEYVVGDPATGRFFAVPLPGVCVLSGLHAGMTIGEAGMDASTPEATVDALDFARTLLHVGFVTEVDGQPLQSAKEIAEVTEFNAAAGRLGRLLFSRSMLVMSGLVLAVVIATFLIWPTMRPRFDDLFVHPQPGVSFALLFAMSLASGLVHELCHWWAARSLGVPARIRLSRRLYMPVMETDVSGLWSLPAPLRYGPFLAGMMFDVLTLAVAVALRLGWSTELIDLPPALVRILGAFVTLKVFEIMFQCLVFLRTDLYAVMITALGLRNLDRVTRLRLKAFFHIARPDDLAELEAAHPRDVAATRWYSFCYLIGLLWAVWFFKTWFYPWTFVVVTWMTSTLGNAPIGSGYWWQAVVVATLVSANVVWPLAVFVRQRMARRRGVLA